MVKRYEPHLKEVRGEDPTATMLEWVNGDWVEFGDLDALTAELDDTKDALHVILTAAKRDPSAPFDWPDRNERIGLVLAKAVERANIAAECNSEWTFDDRISQGLCPHGYANADSCVECRSAQAVMNTELNRGVTDPFLVAAELIESRARIRALEAELAEARNATVPGSARLFANSTERIRILETELADWKRMRNEAMAVATSNRERINELESANGHCHEAMRRLAGRVVDLEAALRKAMDTFADIGNVMFLLQRPLVAAACEVARLGCGDALGPTAETKGDEG